MDKGPWCFLYTQTMADKLIAELVHLRTTGPPRLPPRTRTQRPFLLLKRLSPVGAVAFCWHWRLFSDHDTEKTSSPAGQGTAGHGCAQALQRHGNTRKRRDCRLHLQDPLREGLKARRSEQTAHFNTGLKYGSMIGIGFASGFK